MNRRRINGGFETNIYYKGYCIELRVGYEYYVGTTSATGDDPTEITLDYAIDGANNDILNKLPDSIIKELEEKAYEHGGNWFDEYLYY